MITNFAQYYSRFPKFHLLFITNKKYSYDCFMNKDIYIIIFLQDVMFLILIFFIGPQVKCFLNILDNDIPEVF